MRERDTEKSYDFIVVGGGMAGVCAAMEFAKSGIRVNAVCPGVVLTPMWDKQIVSYAKKRNIKPEEVMPYFASKIPMGRIGTLEEVVGVTFFLASEDSAYLTGQALNVAGGQVM